MTLDIILDADPEWDSNTGWDELARSAATAAIAESAFPQLADGPRAVEISLRLGRDEEVRLLNAQWRGKDQTTNVLSFPMAEGAELTAAIQGPELMLGDIILAHGVCEREARERSVPIERHATHLIVHGTLHLLGYDHGGDREAADMEAREIRALARIGISDPYALQVDG
ncbi:MAG: rRNA maturation RNase YbeY [Sphingomicrobium sp.]